MDPKSIYLGKTKIHSEKKNVTGQFVEFEGEKYYKISNYDHMQQFFISIISSSDHWMFISSNGSLTAGRKNRDNALFPYYTEDKIHDHREITGSSSHFIVEKKDKSYLWQPFSKDNENIYTLERNIYKNFFGNKIIFEEINKDLEVTFRYGWYNSEKFGFVKRSILSNAGSDSVLIKVLDGIKNILPYGVDYKFQNEYSNLLDAYKKNELIEDSKIGLFTLSSIPVDRAEPSESLYATTVFSTGFRNSKILISSHQIDAFIKGLNIKTEVDIRAQRGAYFIHSDLKLSPHKKKEWLLVAEINQNSSDVSNLNQLINNNTENLKNLINANIDEGTCNLMKIASSADGLQLTNTKVCYARHCSNTIYNVMRGGIFTNHYLIDINDFQKYLSRINKPVSTGYQDWLNHIPAISTYSELIAQAEKTGDPDLLRITCEYLPLTFSRRHGDPSRPWNIFSIETRNEDGSAKYNYEGNWRDIFQNWEALSYSYPGFVEGMICKFLNASTFDGFNPYRIMREGIDWECPDPNDPWAYIGYWGDHQIIYLQKLLEISNNFHPERLGKLLNKEIFTYANVPYKIKPYEEIVKNPKDTIIFNRELNDSINEMEDQWGADAKLLKNRDGDKIYKVNLMEKILVSLLSKLSNFIPEAGIWLNTQRPEWNDANNALVGNGTSMVTLYYLRRFLTFWEKKLSDTSIHEFAISEEVISLFDNIYRIFEHFNDRLSKGFSEKDRKKFTDSVGKAGEYYRNQIYNNSFAGSRKYINKTAIINFIETTLKHVDHSINANKRDDGLYHAYNLISFKENTVKIRHLYEMLEGQVAVLSSGYLSPEESLAVLEALKISKMYRPDQYSYMLYPDRELPKFIEKNIIPEESVKESKLLGKLIENRETSIINIDKKGKCHFNSDFRNATVLEEALNKLTDYKTLVKEEKNKVLEVYEAIFDHKSFTGRSGTFYGYEGLGSIYWHMVSKLLLATQENFFKAIDEDTDKNITGKLQDFYYEIKAGIGLYKSPELYGAFPTDAYSHTPGNAGVKQPGLTGQVKEDVISRIGEVGIRIKNGEIHFNHELLNQEEILTDNEEFEFYDLENELQKIRLETDQLIFTFCQIPVIYKHSKQEQMIITLKNKKQIVTPGRVLNKEISEKIFNRDSEIKRIDVYLKNFKTPVR